MIFAAGISNQFESTVEFRIQGLTDYRVFFASTKDEKSFFEGSTLAQNYYIARLSDELGYEIIDSIYTRKLFACDTNAIAYEEIDDTNTYIVVLTLSPIAIYDTLISLRSKDPDNWISKMEMGIECSIKDSIITYWQNPLAVNDEFRILKILPDNEWEMLRTFRNIGNIDITLDFSQLLICTRDSLTEDNLSPNRLFIYEICSDSLYPIDELGSGIIRAQGFYRDSAMYYLKDIYGNRNIWKYSHESGNIRLTDIDKPFYICEFSIRERERLYSLPIKEFIIVKRSLDYSICNWNDQSYLKSSSIYIDE